MPGGVKGKRPQQGEKGCNHGMTFIRRESGKASGGAAVWSYFKGCIGVCEGARRAEERTVRGNAEERAHDDVRMSSPDRGQQ